MKRIIAALAAAVTACAIFLTGCTPKPDGTVAVSPSQGISAPSEPAPADGALTYTNLTGKAVQDEVEDILLSAGISEERTETLFQWVDDFNECMSGCETFDLKDGFTTVNIPVVDYGEYYPMSVQWFKTSRRDYGDVLCRIAAFQLMQDYVDTEKLIDKEQWECYSENHWLYSDWDAISNHPLISFDEDQQSRYFTLFNPVAISPGCSADEMYENISAEWERRGISFSESKVSLITIWTQYRDQTATAHAAVLVEYPDGLLLVEKTNPQSPYQASIFSSIGQVKQYMYESIHIEDVRYGDETGAYLVLQNDKRL